MSPEVLKKAYELVNSEEYSKWIKRAFAYPESPWFGHGFLRHTGMSDSELKIKAQKLKKAITAATTLDISSQQVCDILVDTLTDLDQIHSVEIALWWYSETTEYFHLIVEKDYVVGHGYYTNPFSPWDRGVQQGNRIVYVLRKEPGEGQFMVVTTYAKLGVK